MCGGVGRDGGRCGGGRIGGGGVGRGWGGRVGVVGWVVVRCEVVEGWWVV